MHQRLARQKMLAKGRLEGLGLRGMGGAARRAAGVVDQDLRRMIADNVGHRDAQAVGLRHVHGEPAMVLALLAGQRLGDGLERISRARQQGHAGTQLSQLDGACAADALRCTADEGVTPTQVQQHGEPPRKIELTCSPLDGECAEPAQPGDPGTITPQLSPAGDAVVIQRR